MKARFKGKTSMGFKTGQIYNIRSELKPIIKTNMASNKKMACIYIYDINSMARCPYQTLEAFLNNWEVLR